jgi:PAS domain S-box-containing protein
MNLSKNIRDSLILVVDDTEENLYVLERILARHEFSRIISADSGSKAILMIREQLPDLVLLDIHMPQMDGFQVCKIIKEDPKTIDIPVIFLTARYKDLEHKVHGLDIGADDYITKPFISQELVARVNVALRLKIVQDQLKATNIELINSQIELEKLNESLEVKVSERTAQLKESEEKYRLLMEKASDAIILIDCTRATIIDANEKGEDLLGCKKNQLIGESLRKYIAPEDYHRIEEKYPSLFIKKREDFLGVVILNKKGKELITDVNLSLITYAEHQLIQCIFHDLTNRKLMQEQLMNNEKLAAIGVLAASVAHEINNPLSIISGFAEELSNKIKENEKGFEEVNIINQEVTRLSGLVKDLLKFARPSKTSIQAIEILELLKRTHSLVRSRLRSAKVNWVQSISDDLPKVFADDTQILQVLINVIINALDAMPNGGEIRFSCIVNKPDNLILTITDTGHGIPPNVLDKIFDPFYTTKELKGTGLGLTICKQIMEENKGTIFISSEVNVGTSVKLTLPTIL